MKRTKPWELSDEVWERVQPLIPERPAHPKGGRTALSHLVCAAHGYPMECPAAGTGSQHHRLRSLPADGEQQGVFERIWQAGLQDSDELDGVAWQWQSMDGVMSHPPLSVEPRPAPIPPIAASGEPNAAN